MRVGIARTGIVGVAVWLWMPLLARAANDPQQAAVQQAIGKGFELTKATADNADIIMPGSPIVLHKDGLQMCGIIAKVPLTSTYKNGSFSAARLAWGMALGMAHSNLSVAEIPIRKFVAGEKFWITAIEVKKSGVVVHVLSDSYADIRYFGQIEFPFDKKSVPTDDVLKTITEVVTAEPIEDRVQSQSSLPEEVPAAPLQPIAPPPPPGDEPPAPPKTISLGQTKDQVVAILGQPQKIANLGTKEIDYYPDMKVVLVKGKVTDIQ